MYIVVRKGKNTDDFLDDMCFNVLNVTDNEIDAKIYSKTFPDSTVLMVSKTPSIDNQHIRQCIQATGLYKFHRFMINDNDDIDNRFYAISDELKPETLSETCRIDLFNEDCLYEYLFKHEDLKKEFDRNYGSNLINVALNIYYRKYDDKILSELYVSSTVFHTFDDSEETGDMYHILNDPDSYMYKNIITYLPKLIYNMISYLVHLLQRDNSKLSECEMSMKKALNRFAMPYNGNDKDDSVVWDSKINEKIKMRSTIHLELPYRFDDLFDVFSGKDLIKLFTSKSRDNVVLSVSREKET